MLRHEFKIKFTIKNKQLDLFLKNISRCIVSKGHMKIRIQEGIWNHTVYLTRFNFELLEKGNVDICIDAYFQTRGELKLEQVTYKTDLARHCYQKFMNQLSVLKKFK